MYGGKIEFLHDVLSRIAEICGWATGILHQAIRVVGLRRGIESGTLDFANYVRNRLAVIDAKRVERAPQRGDVLL